MSNYNEKIWILITRKLTGEATPEEQVELRRWLSEDPDHREFYQSIEFAWNQEPGASVNTPFFFDYDSGLEKLRGKLDQESPTPIKKNTLTSQRRSSRRSSWAIATPVLLVILLFSVLVTSYFGSTTNSENLKSSYTTSGVEQRIVTLSDGSVVRLNRNSKIDIQQGRDNEFITVQLEGEAYFDVSKNPNRPFIIHAGEAVVQVLGTAFNVKEGNEVIVAVQEGVVSFRHKNLNEKSSARLTAGHLGLLAEDGHDVKIERVNIENYMSWMNGYLRFNNTPFGQVIKQLERIYGINHQLQDPSLRSYQLTVYTEQIRQMDEVLESIARALNLEFEKYEDTIVWQKREPFMNEPQKP